eukprot:jgi/Bigna1/146795/aug1.121_g21503
MVEFLDADDQEQEIRRYEEKAKWRQRCLENSLVVGGGFLSTIFLFYAAGQFREMYSDDGDLEFNPSPFYGRIIGSLASASSFILSTHITRTKRTDAFFIFYTFPVVTILYFAICYTSLDVYNMELEFMLWRGAKYNYKQA